MTSVRGLVANTDVAVAVELRGARAVTIGVTSVLCEVNVLLVLYTNCVYTSLPRCLYSIANFQTMAPNACLKATTVSDDAADEE